MGMKNSNNVSLYRYLTLHAMPYHGSVEEIFLGLQRSILTVMTK